MSARRSGVLGGALLAFAVLVGAVPAAAATTSSWAVWQPLEGDAGAYTTSVQIAATPSITASVTSDSRGGQVGVISGASVWVSEGTPVGAKYGSSRDQPYLNLRAKADNAAGASTTTYSFATPTPASGWTFVLGDIDADSVRIQAIAADGHALDATEIGYRGGFNYCAPGVVGKPSCTGDATDIPSWDPSTLTLTGNDAAADTSGAAGWFEPSTPIVSLSLIFTRRAGLPVYQTWFASLARDITGTVTDLVDGPLDGVDLTLTDANGAVIATTTTSGGGVYSFPGMLATEGYTVRVSAPDGKIAEGATTRAVDLTDADGVADLTVRDIVPVSVAGRVLDTDGQPVAGVVVSIDGRTTTTDTDGRYLFDGVGVGEHTATITTPDGFTLVTTAPPFTVPDGSEAPITDVDFVIAENPSLSGTVRASGVGVAGVIVTASGPGGVSRSTVTGADGEYSFDLLTPGAYTIGIEVPDGFAAAGVVSRSENVVDDVVDVDFALVRLGAIGGTVRDDGGAPVGQVLLTLSSPDGQQPLATSADGAYGFGALQPGTYTLTMTPPTGTSPVGSVTRTVVITEAGEVFVDQDFVLTLDAVPPVTPPPSSGGQGGSVGVGGAVLAASGPTMDGGAWTGLGAAALLLGGALLLWRRRSARV